MIADSIENEKSPPQEWIENGDTSKTVSKEEETMGHDILDITTTSPYKEFNFWGTYLGLCLGSACSFGGLLMTGTSLALINAAVGPDPNYIWINFALVICLAVGSVLVGRLSDLFGRRWFFVGTAASGLIGAIVGCTAHSINQLIASSVFIGLAASGQANFNYVIAEIVPVNHRFYWMSLMYFVISPMSAFGPVIARLFIAYTAAGWRWIYYLLVILNGFQLLCYLVCYKPPKFQELHRSRSKWDEVRDMDFVGFVLFTAGLVLFILGLSWGGTVHPWKSAQVIATVVIGFVLLIALGVYESFMPLRRPLIPMHLFKNKDFSAITTVTTVGGMLYYSLNIVYPTMVAVLFTSDIVTQGLLICAIAATTCLGQVLGAGLAVPGGHSRYKVTAGAVGMMAFAGGMAGAGESKPIATALVCLASLSVGVVEGLAIGIVTVVVDQTELGAAGGLFSSLRTVGGVVATAIFSSILTNKVTDYTKTIVVPNVLAAGLPATSVEELLEAIASGSVSTLEAVPGVSENIIGVAVASTKLAYTKSFELIFLVSIAFGGAAVIAACFSPKIEDRLTHDVVRRLHAEGLLHYKEKKTGGPEPIV